jgi:hypothetical protein
VSHHGCSLVTPALEQGPNRPNVRPRCPSGSFQESAKVSGAIFARPAHPAGNERAPTMNQISAIDERGHILQEGRTAAEDVEYGRHAAPHVKDPGDYHGKHRSEDAYLKN